MESPSFDNNGKNHNSLENEIGKEDKPDFKNESQIKGNNKFSYVTKPDNKVSRSDTKKMILFGLEKIIN